MTQTASSQTSFQLTNTELDAAFREGMFNLVHQPQIATSGGAIFGAESFTRWQHPIYGTIPPALFLHFVENQGRSRELTNYVLKNAIDATSKWQRADLNWHTTVNINLSDLVDGTLPYSIDILVRECGFDLTKLIIDIPENDLAQNWHRKWSNISETLIKLKDKGIGIALDSSGPNFLESEQIDAGLFDYVKLGGKALLQFASDTNNLPFSLISKRLEFAKANNLQAMAVGAEDFATLYALKSFGFDYIQGHIVTMPLSAENLSDWRRNYMPPSAFLGDTVPPGSNAEESFEEIVLTSIETSTETLDVDWSATVAGFSSEEVEVELSATSKRMSSTSVDDGRSVQYKVSALTEMLRLFKKS